MQTFRFHLRNSPVDQALDEPGTVSKTVFLHCFAIWTQQNHRSTLCPQYVQSHVSCGMQNLSKIARARVACANSRSFWISSASFFMIYVLSLAVKISACVCSMRSSSASPQSGSNGSFWGGAVSARSTKLCIGFSHFISVVGGGDGLWAAINVALGCGCRGLLPPELLSKSRWEVCGIGVGNGVVGNQVVSSYCLIST